MDARTSSPAPIWPRRCGSCRRCPRRARPASRRSTSPRAAPRWPGCCWSPANPADPTNPLAVRRWLNPVNAAAASALVSGAFSASKVLRQPDPTPQPLTAWHALDPEIVYARLAGRARPLAVEPGMPGWRRVLEDLSYSPVVSPLRGPARQVGQAAVRDPGRTRRSAHPDPGRRRGRVGDRGQQRRRAAGRRRDDRQRVDRRRATAAGRRRGRRIVRRTRPIRAPRRGARRWRPPDAGWRRPGTPSARSRSTATALRPGDVIDLAAPDVVPADARLLVAEDLEVDESLLTGESSAGRQAGRSGRGRRHRAGQHAVRGQHDRRRTCPGDRGGHRRGHRGAPRDLGGRRRRVVGRGAGAAARADRQGASADAGRWSRGDGSGVAAPGVAASGGRRRRRDRGGRRPRRPAVGGDAVAARRRPAAVDARRAGPRSPHHRGAGPRRHGLLRQDRHAHRKPAARWCVRCRRRPIRTARSPASPNRRRPGCCRPPHAQRPNRTRRRGTPMPPTRRSSKLRRSLKRRCRSGTCSPKFRSSPAVASPPRSARSARIRRSLC